MFFRALQQQTGYFLVFRFLKETADSVSVPLRCLLIDVFWFLEDEG